MSEADFWKFSEKLQLLLDRRQKTGPRLAESTGLSRAAVIRWLEGSAAPRPNALHRIAASLNVPPEALDPASREVVLPFVEQSPAAGVVVLTFQGEECPPLWMNLKSGEVRVVSEHYCPFRVKENCQFTQKSELNLHVALRWLQEAVPDNKEQEAMTVVDNTMAPRIESGSLLIFEKTSDYTIPGVYVITIDGKPAVRRLSKEPRTFAVSCDNRDYKTYKDPAPTILGKALKVIRSDDVR